MNAIEIEIEFKDVDVRFAQESPLPRLNMACDDGAQIGFAHAAFLGHLRNLEVGAGGRNVRIKPGAGSGHQIHGHGRRGILGLQALVRRR